MGLFNFISNAQEKIEKKADELVKKTDALNKSLQEQTSEDMLKSFIDKSAKEKQGRRAERAIVIDSTEKPNKTARMIINRYYSDYPEIPYISNSREKNWIEKADLFPKQSLVKREMMERYADGLLPGHVYMLYWLKKFTNKKVPAYFEYKYGINFEKEKMFLIRNKYLSEELKPTEIGLKIIEEHYSVVENHKAPAVDMSTEGITKLILEQKDKLVEMGFKEYTYIANQECCEVCKKLDGMHYKLADLQVGENAPPMHDGCKCSISAYEDEAEYQKWLNSL